MSPTLLLSYHIDFEPIPLTFCPRNKRKAFLVFRIPKKPVNQQPGKNPED